TAGAQVADEAAHVIGLVGAQRDTTPRAPAIEHDQRRFALGRARRQSDRPIHNQAVAVLHQRVAHVAELGRLAVALLVEPRLGVRGAPVRLVGALLLLEAALGVAAGTVGVVVAAVLAPEALQRSPGL